ncbi:MAG: tetratricopeptide repeat protein [Nitrospinae bacterium]|nr:tetratricopeptide repeat protein [Nitrospinota bacterium]
MSLRILVIDDMGAMRMQVKSVLTDLGFSEILTAAHGKEAFDKLLALHDIPDKHIELVLSDWNMQPINGLQLLGMVRKDLRLKDVFFLLLTAEQARDNIIAALQAGVDEYIIKPFNHATLKKKFENLVTVKLAEITKQFTRLVAPKGGEEGQLDALPEERLDKLLAFTAKKYSLLMKVAPWSSAPHTAMGNMYLLCQRHAEAEPHLRRAIALSFGDTAAHASLSRALRAQGKLAASIEEMEVALQLSPASWPLRQQLGEAYLKAGDHSRAILHLAEAQKAAEQTGDARGKAKSMSAMGMAKMGKGEQSRDVALLKEGVGEIQKAAAVDPDLLSAQYNLMVAYRKMGKKEEALAVFDRIQAIEPTDVEGWIALALAYLGRDDLAKAVFAFTKAAGLAADKCGVYSEAANDFYQKQAYEQALDFAQKARAENPSDFQSYNVAGLVYRARGELKPAITEYTLALDLDPENAGLLFNLGFAYAKSGDADRGKQYLGQAVEKAPALAPKVEEALASIS